MCQHIGPLVDGAVVSRASLGQLVRETALHANALFAQTASQRRSPVSTRRQMLTDVIAAARKDQVGSYYSRIFV